MSTRLLSKEAVAELRKNPYVRSASQRCVSYTAAFKELAYEELCRGKTVRQIFEQSGFDVEVLGEKRLSNFRATVEALAESERGFEDGRKTNRRQEAQSTEAQLARKVKQLEHQVAYLQQENDFLKKIQEAGKELQQKAGGTNCRRK